MSSKWNKIKVAVVFLIVCLFMLAGGSQSKAAERIEVNRPYEIRLEKYDSRLYQFTVPSAGNISVHLKNTDPVGKQEIEASLYNSNNLQITDVWRGINVDLPLHSSDAGSTYYLKLDDGDSAWKTTYLLTVEFQTTSNWETENNDGTNSADVITPNRTWYGRMNDKNEGCDIFKFKLAGNRKVKIKFGPAEVDGKEHVWKVLLLNSANDSVCIYEDHITRTYSCYLKKGTYYLKVEPNGNTRNVTYAFSYSTSAIKIKKPKITSIKGTAHKGWFDPNYVLLHTIKIKNSGDCTGYTVKVAKKKSMKGKQAQVDVDFGENASKGKVSLSTQLNVLKRYYLKVRAYVSDLYGNKMYGKYSKVKCKKTKKSTYNEYKN